MSSAVGLAMAGRYSRGLLDPDAPVGASPFDTTTWVIASDGDLEEGISGEAASLAGTQRLGDLVVIWDDNRISIEGDTAVASTRTSRPATGPTGGTSRASTSIRTARRRGRPCRAMAAARDEHSAASLIHLRTVIAWPAPTLRNTGKPHGSALGAAEVAATKVAPGMDRPSLRRRDQVLADAREVGQRGAGCAPMGGRLPAVADGRPRCCDPAGSARGPAAPGRLARRAAHLGARAVDRHAGLFREGHQRPGRRAARALGRFGGPGRSNGTTIKGGGSFLPAGSLLPDAVPTAGHRLRLPRARDGCGPQWDPLNGLTRVCRGDLPGVHQLLRPRSAWPA